MNKWNPRKTLIAGHYISYFNEASFKIDFTVGWRCFYDLIFLYIFTVDFVITIYGLFIVLNKHFYYLYWRGQCG